MANPRICSVDGCDKQSVAKALCSSHYQRMAKHGDPLAGGAPNPRERANCKVEGCNQPHYGKGYCTSHWSRWRRYGDPLGGNADRGAPLAFLLDASTTETSDCLLWPFARNTGGYAIVWFEGKIEVASRIMCAWAHGPAPFPDAEAAHSCGHGEQGCVSPSHLRWATPAQNAADKIAHGTVTRGQKINHAKLSDDQVVKIVDLSSRMTQDQIAEQFGIHRATVSDICRGKTWGWLTGR